jgi:putative (di)nucleoside polyphosphate hydrolase
VTQPAQYFRAGAGAVIVNDDGLVLALERSDVRLAWQLPQGGLRADEDPLDGVYREVEEETGIRPDRLGLLAEYPEPLAYELPKEFRTAKTGRGQTHYWFLFRLRGGDESIDLTLSKEFRSWSWTSMGGLIETVLPFRASVYRRLAIRFAEHLYED